MKSILPKIFLNRNLLRRDLIAILASLSGVTVLSWWYVIDMAREMTAMELIRLPVWNAGYFWMMFLMWTVMMAGMMLPTAFPMILIYAGVCHKDKNRAQPVIRAGVFTLGYLFTWTAFSLFATAVQWQMDEWLLLSPMMVAQSPLFGAVILVAAGIYQWLPLKNQCLNHCRHPALFISEHWKPGGWGAWRMGLEHGLFCTGCCWVLMLLLFVGGVMNVLWIAVITFFVLLEKVLPFGRWAGRWAGIAMFVTGVRLLILAAP